MLDCNWRYAGDINHGTRETDVCEIDIVQRGRGFVADGDDMLAGGDELLKVALFNCEVTVLPRLKS